MTTFFDESFNGLQIAWSDDQEIEYLGPNALLGKPRFVAASCIFGHGRKSYLYPVTARVEESSNRLTIIYRQKPKGWPKDWEIEQGDLVIEFESVFGGKPRSIRYHYLEDDHVDELIEGEDWRYTPTDGIQDQILQTRDRISTSKLARPAQQRLRSLLLAERLVCQITNTGSFVALEACHIVPVKNGGPDLIENALLLRRDLHALFDAGLLQFELVERQWLISVDESIEDSHYRELNRKIFADDRSQHHAYLLARQELEKTRSTDP